MAIKTYDEMVECRKEWQRFLDKMTSRDVQHLPQIALECYHEGWVAALTWAMGEIEE